MRRNAPGESAEVADATRATPPQPVSRPVRLPIGRDDEIAAAVHEVQNALTSVLGWLEVANGSDDAAVRARALRVIENGVQRAKNLVARLADPTERFSVRSRAFRIAPLIAETHELLHPRCAAAGVGLTVDSVDDDVVALGDPDRVVQIVMNLVLNAVDAVLAVPAREAPRGSIHLAVVQDERTVTIVVRDDGTGMDEATRARVFDPYFTTHPTAQGRRKAGTGLGLAISRALADAMGGTLGLISSPGAGTTVSLSLAREGAVPSVSPPPEASEFRAGTRVLVVDDEPAIRELLDVALSLRGAEVVTAASLSDARGALASQRFDAILIDETLGQNESGAALVVELKRTTPQLATILMTGAPSVEHLPPEASQRLLRKPFALDDVVRLIGTSVESVRA